MNKGQNLWKKAKKIIPGGSQLLSKRAEMFLPNHWPSYYSMASGTKIWDLDGRKYTDMSLMGVGSCILGYADPDVNKAVKQRIDYGNMTTLNCPEEIELAQLLLRQNKWAGGVRYTRSGGEAMNVAVRIARGYSKKDKIAICGYHGWNDWYLATNLSNKKGLDNHLLKGLNPIGVPRKLAGTTIPFHYNNIEELKKIVEKNNDIGVIVMEVIRDKLPQDGFLKKVRKIADDNNIVLIFDEITSGFRTTIGGYYKLFGVIPDIVVFGKAMSNGYPMGAVVGKREIMDVAQNSFISSTYWTEGIGSVASLATINKMKDKDVPYHITKASYMVYKTIKLCSQEAELLIDISRDFPPILHFDFYQNKQALATLFTQEMLRRGFLASRGIYLSYAHTEDDIENYRKNILETFKIIKKAIDERNIEKLLRGPIAHAGFQRLT